jgi:hypothetical protein
MATTRKTKAKAKDVGYDDLPESGKLAHDIVATYGDLRPSVTKILDAELSEGQKVHALSAFQASIGVPGDANRNPAVAIEQAARTAE